MKTLGEMMIATNLARFLSITFIWGGVFLGAGAALSANAGGPLPGEGLSQSYRESQMDNVEYQKVEPIKMGDNLYYVGPGYVGVYLVTTPEGHILIDASEDPYVDHVLGNIRKVGADPADIKYIIISHGHLDHFGGVAAIQDLSGAQVGAVAEDWEMIEERSQSPGRNQGPPPRMPRKEMVIKQGDTISLGGQTVKLHVTPGHTAGVMSAEFTVYDNGAPHKAFFSGGTGGRGGHLNELAVESTSRVVAIDDIEMFLPNHAWNEGVPYPNGSIFERALRVAAGQPNPFIDGEAWEEWITKVHQRNIDVLAQDRLEARQQ
nr:MAG: MBL fold metallo-hydrolase [Hyphomicrobiales bacterium]